MVILKEDSTTQGKYFFFFFLISTVFSECNLLEISKRSIAENVHCILF